MATIHSILGLIFGIGIIGHGLPHCNLLEGSITAQPRNPQHATHNRSEHITRSRILNIARSQLYVRETGRNNFGKEIKAYLAYTHLLEGNPYCAAFVSWVYFKAGYQQPRTAWSPDLFPLKRCIKDPEPADVLGIYSAAKGRIVHCGIVEKLQHDWIVTLEANTNDNGSSDGNGNYRKWRHKRTIAKFANWTKK